MSIHIIPVNKLSPEALQGVIKEYISRAGTDYGEIEASPEASFGRVKHKLENGLAGIPDNVEHHKNLIIRMDGTYFCRFSPLDKQVYHALYSTLRFNAE